MPAVATVASVSPVSGNEQTSRSVLVTGGNRGIGRAVVERLLAQGHRVASIARTGEPAPGALGITADVTEAEQFEAAVVRVEQEQGPVEVLVANAGITRDTLLMRMSDEDWSQVLEVNLSATFRAIRRVSRGMVRARFGRIIVTGSVVGLYGSAGQANYAATKAALVGLVRSVTRELGSRGITANVVAPGFITTDMTAGLTEEVRDRYLQTIPAHRFGTPQEVAAAVAFLAGEGAGYISGAVIPVDGGLGMGH